MRTSKQRWGSAALAVASAYSCASSGCTARRDFTTMSFMPSHSAALLYPARQLIHLPGETNYAATAVHADVWVSMAMCLWPHRRS